MQSEFEKTFKQHRDALTTYLTNLGKQRQVQAAEWDIEQNKSDYEFYFNAGWQAAKAQALPEWISVEDRLPDNHQRVTGIGFDYGDVKNKRHYVVCEYFDSIWLGDEDEEFEYITHWMPLPEPPTEECK